MKRLSAVKLMGFGVVALLLELTALDVLSWAGGRPELVLIIACFSAMFARDGGQAAIVCWALGGIKDLASAGPLGWHALFYLLLGVVLVRMRHLLFRDHVLIQALVGAGAAFAIGVVTAGWMAIGGTGLSVGACLGRLFVSVLLTALMAPVVMVALAQTRTRSR